MLKVGLTGGIGTGKTTVLDLFREMGARVQSADTIVHELIENDRNIIAKISELLGPQSVDSTGKLDRAYIASLIFSSVPLRLALEDLLHPRVLAQIAEWLDDQIGEGIAVVEVPLLFETHSEYLFDVTLMIAAEQENQLHRLLSRGLDIEDSKRRMASQWPMAEKIRRATFTIYNDGSLADLAMEVERIWDILQTSSGCEGKPV